MNAQFLGLVILALGAPPGPAPGRPEPPSSLTPIVRIVGKNGEELSSPVTSERVGVRTSLGIRITPPVANPQVHWTIGGPAIKTYLHDVDEPLQHVPVLLAPADLSAPAVVFFWTDEGNPHTVSVQVIAGGVTLSDSLDFDVSQELDPNFSVYTRDGDPDRTPDGLINTYRILASHGAWHAGGLMAGGEVPAGSVAGGNWGDFDASGILYGPGFAGEAFHFWHRAILDSHSSWRTTFNVVAPDLSTPVPQAPAMPAYLRLLPGAPGPWPVASQQLGCVRLGEFQDRNEAGRATAFPWHNYSHLQIGFSGYGFMQFNAWAPHAQDSVFWRYHTTVDGIRADFGPDRAQVLTTVPAHESSVPSLTSFVVAFDRRVSANAPAANKVQILPQALTVNGSPATTVTDVGPATYPSQAWSFSGFAPPGSGVVQVTLLGTAGYDAGAWKLKRL